MEAFYLAVGEKQPIGGGDGLAASLLLSGGILAATSFFFSFPEMLN